MESIIITYLRYRLKNQLKNWESTDLTIDYTKDNLYADYGIFNPAIGTSNLGDYIIYESVQRELSELFPNDIFTEFPTQLHSSIETLKALKTKKLCFVAGTNLLSSNLDRVNQWKIDLNSIKYLENKIILMGCGWWQYQNGINSYTEKIYQKILNKEHLHSVRDEYTLNKLKSIGINNVVNTSCPTLWSLKSESLKLIKKNRSENVITTLTFYHKNNFYDSKLLKILSENYKIVYLWLQGILDYHYYNSLNLDLKNVVLVSPNLESYQRVLDQNNVDYIGSRLHAGIRAIQSNIRTLIIAVDNRALEIAATTSLNVIPRENVESITRFIYGEYETAINIPIGEINSWKNSLR